MKRGPTARQHKAVLDTLANIGGKQPAKSKKEILLAAGYSPAIAKNPQLVEQSKGWIELMEQYLPDSKLAQVHSEGLEANKIISANISYGDADEKTNDFIEVPDHQTRHKYLDLAYKIKGKQKEDAATTTVNISLTSIKYLSDTELERIARGGEEGVSEEGVSQKVL